MSCLIHVCSLSFVQNRASSVDSEVEDILNRQVCRLKTLDSVDPNYGAWTPTTHQRIHMVSPLLNLRERELYTVGGHRSFVVSLFLGLPHSGDLLPRQSPYLVKY